MRSRNGPGETRSAAPLSGLLECLGPAQAGVGAVSGPEGAEAGRSPPPGEPLVGPVSYQVPPVGQPPLDAVAQVRAAAPPPVFLIVNELPDFDVVLIV